MREALCGELLAREVNHEAMADAGPPLEVHADAGGEVGSRGGAEVAAREEPGGEGAALETGDQTWGRRGSDGGQICAKMAADIR